MQFSRAGLDAAGEEREYPFKGRQGRIRRHHTDRVGAGNAEISCGKVGTGGTDFPEGEPQMCQIPVLDAGVQSALVTASTDG